MPRRRKRPNTSKPTPGSTRELLGLRVRALRVERSMTQRQLSAEANVSAVFLGVIERGEKSVGVETLERVAGALGVPLLELFRFSGGKAPSRNPASPLEALLKRVASLGRAAGPEALLRLERIAEIVLAPEGERTHRPPRKGFTPIGKRRAT